MGWLKEEKREKKLNHFLVEDGTGKEFYLRREINYLESMTFRKEAAIQDAAYIENCFDSFLMAWDRGRLTLNLEYKL